MTQRYMVDWTIFPKGPWIVRDLETGAAAKRNGATHFWHGELAAAVKFCDHLNRRKP